MYAALTASPATYPVYAPVPQGVPKPYIAFGPRFADPDEALAAASTDASIQLDAWSAQSSEAQIEAMGQFIRARLDGQAITGAWSCTEEAWEVMEDPASTASSRLYHGVARYRVRVG